MLVEPKAGFIVPQALTGTALIVKVTESPETPAPLGPVTVAVTVEVLVPLAGTADELALTVTTFGVPPV
jgi:hypothetical protein